MNKKLVCLSALALSLSMTQVTFACDKMSHFGGDRMEKLTTKLDLTADQKAKIKTIRDQAHQANQPKFDQLHTLHAQMNDLLSASTVDESKLDDMISQEKDLLGAIIKTHAMEKHDISNVLTDQQKTKFKALLQQWEEKHKEKKAD